MSDSSHIQLRAGLSDAAALLMQQSGKGNGEVQHVTHLSENLGALYLTGDFSDVTLKVDDEKFPAHRVILASRSEYFRAMFYGGMREQCDKEVELLETPVTAFKALLRYIYTSKLSLSGMREELVIDILGLAHKYGFEELQTAIKEYLQVILNQGNFCHIFNISQLYNLCTLTDFCLLYADRNAKEVLGSQGFLQLSSSAVEELISRDSFCAPEVEIFKALQEWIAVHSTEESRALLPLIRLSLISMSDLFKVVRATGLLTADEILDAIEEQQMKNSANFTHRGVLLPDTNVATAVNAIVICGESPSSLFNGDAQARRAPENTLTRHEIRRPVEEQEGIVVELNGVYIINCIGIQLWDREARMYSYYIEVSLDNKDWVRVIDHTNHKCRSTQTLLFNKRAAKYIRVVGTFNSVGNIFCLASMEVMYTPEPFTIDPDTKLPIPSSNVATIEKNAIVLEGVSRCRYSLVNGDTTNYDWDNGYTCHQINSGEITVQLPQPYLIGSMSLLLWDCDERYYSFYIEVSVDQENWQRVVDKTGEQCRSWQYLEFKPVPVVFVRIVGVYNSANEVFHCVHFGCPARQDDARTVTVKNNRNGMQMIQDGAGGSQERAQGHQAQQGIPRHEAGHDQPSTSRQGFALPQWANRVDANWVQQAVLAHQQHAEQFPAANELDLPEVSEDR